MLRTGSAVAVCALACVACGGMGDGAPPAPGWVPAGSGARMCSVLRTADLGVVGLRPALSAPAVTVGDGGRSVTCGWSTSPLAAERLALALHYPASDAPAVWTTALGALEPFVSLSRPALPWMDDGLVGSTVAAAQPDGRAFPWILVRRGRLVLSLEVPAGPRAHDQLVALASTVLARLPDPATSRAPASPPAPGSPDACRAVSAQEVQSALGTPAAAGEGVELVVLGDPWSDCTFASGPASVNVLVEDRGSHAAAMDDARLVGSSMQVDAAGHEVPVPGIGEAAWTGPPSAYSSAVLAVRGSQEVVVTASGEAGPDYAAVARRVATAAIRRV
jgi:hypothetical protein